MASPGRDSTALTRRLGPSSTKGFPGSTQLAAPADRSAQAAGHERRVHLCDDGWQAPLLAELQRAYPASAHRPLASAPLAGTDGQAGQARPPAEAAGTLHGFVSQLTAADALAAPTLAFCRQCLPAVAPVGAPSVSAWARLLAEALIAALAEHHGPWRLLLWSAGAPPARARLIEQACAALLKKRQRRLLRSLASPLPAAAIEPAAGDHGGWAPEALAQLVLTGPDTGLLSLALPDQRARLGRVLSPYPAGVPELREDRRPPGRAYLKLLEAEAQLGARIAPGQRCVDLGAAPGSWTHVALERGAQVLAVDRSPLAAELMRRVGLSFARGDAFTWEPGAAVAPGWNAGRTVVAHDSQAAERGAAHPEDRAPPFDWLLCDVIAAPERTLALLERWLLASWCRRYVVTFKFRGADYQILSAVDALLRRRGGRYLLRRLAVNRNEVTAAGALA